MTRRRCLVALVSLVSVAAATSAAGQVFVLPYEAPERPGSWSFTIGAQMADPVGEFGRNVKEAWGGGGTLRYLFRSIAPLGVRVDASFLNYGNETKQVPLSSTINRVLVDMHTTNNIAMITAGPELILLRGPVTPYVYAFAGYSYFYTETDARDDDWAGGSYASTTNFDDGGWATGWGGGLRIPLRLRSVNASIDAGARHMKNGVREYLRRGDIIDVPSGFVTTPRITRADFRQYHLGVSFSWRKR
jgi:hypothetical protein